MEKPPVLTDTVALARHRSRARRAPALFLHEDSAAELQERLLEVNRTFTAPAIVTDFPDPWLAVLPGARIVCGFSRFLEKFHRIKRIETKRFYSSLKHFLSNYRLQIYISVL